MSKSNKYEEMEGKKYKLPDTGITYMYRNGLTQRIQISDILSQSLPICFHVNSLSCAISEVQNSRRVWAALALL